MSSAIGNLKSAVPCFLVLALLVGPAACRPVSRAQMGARAADEWTRSYPLEQGGRVVISNRNGGIDVQGSDAATVEVRAERIAHATTEKIARDLLPRIAMAEDVKPDLVSVRTGDIEGILLGVGFEVVYHVKVPHWANVRAQTNTGDVTVIDVSGRVVANTTAGSVKGENLSGGVEARTVSGNTTVDLAAVGVDPVSLRSTNGVVALTLPPASNANLSASCVNGTVSVDGVHFEPTGEPVPERGRGRRVRGRLNQGGTSIELQTVNGNVNVGARATAAGQD